jgi:hypothetical protein
MKAMCPRLSIFRVLKIALLFFFGLASLDYLPLKRKMVLSIHKLKLIGD